MRYLTEKLIQKEIIRDYSSLVYRQDLSDAKFAFEFLIDEYMGEDEIKNELAEDIYKLTLSVRKNTGGIPKITKEDKEPTEINDPRFLEECYGGYNYSFYILFPSKMSEYKPNELLKKYKMLIPGRPIAKKLNRYYSKITNFVSVDGSKSRISEMVNDIMNEVEIYGLDKLESFDFYVFEHIKKWDENRKYYHILMTYNFKDKGESLIAERPKDKLVKAEMERAEKERKEEAERKRKEEAEQYEKEKEDYFRRKNDYLSQFSGPERYYAEKDWLRSHGDSRFEDFGTMRRSNYTGD